MRDADSVRPRLLDDEGRKGGEGEGGEGEGGEGLEEEVVEGGRIVVLSVLVALTTPLIQCSSRRLTALL